MATWIGRSRGAGYSPSSPNGVAQVARVNAALATRAPVGRGDAKAIAPRTSATWVGRAPSATTGSTAPIISNVVVTPSPTLANVTWDLDQPCQGWVEYGPTTSYGTDTTHETSFTYSSHSQAPSPLSPGTLYHFRIHAVNAAGQHTIRPDDTFTTTGSAGAYPPLSTLSGIAVPAVPALPAVGVLTLDSTTPGGATHYTRLDVGGGVAGVGGHLYSSHQPWNSDGSMFWDHYMGQVLDGNTYAILRSAVGVAREPMWAWTDRLRMYGMNTDHDFGFHNMVTGAWTTLYTFSAATYPGRVYMGMYEGCQSRDDRYFVFQAGRGANDAIIVLDRITGGTPDSCSIRSERHDFGLGSLEGCKASPGGAYVVAMTGSGWASYNASDMSFKRVIYGGNPHADVGYDAAGNEIIVIAEIGGAAGQNVYSHRIDQNTSALDVGRLFPASAGPVMQQCHVSLQCRDLNGWAFITSYSQQNTGPGRGQLVAVPTDGSAVATGYPVRIYGWHRSDDTDAQRGLSGAYDRSPFGCPNNDGTRYAYHCRWSWSGSPTIPCYGFVAQL